jgi:hypothetical protein
MRSPCILCVFVSPCINLWMPEPIFMKLGMYIMAPEPILTASLPSVCVSLCVSLLSRQQHSKHVPAATNTLNNNRIGRVVFYAVRVASKESLWVCLCISMSLLGNGSVSTFPQQQKIVGGVFFWGLCRINGKYGIISSQIFLFWGTLCQSYSSLSRLINDDNFVSCPAVQEPISATPPEIILRLPTLLI